ncbi:putative anion transporter 6 [Chlorella vulgaris]
MAAARAKELRIIEGLASVLGLDGADSVSVLEAVAATLGCTIDDDGTVRLEDDAEPSGRKKRRRQDTAAVEEEEEEGGEEEGDEEEQSEEGGSGSGSSEPADDEDPEDLLQVDFDLTVEPIKVEDTRTKEETEHVERSTPGEAEFQWMLLPVETETFFEAIQDEEPLLISRPNNRTYFDGLFSRAEIEKMLKSGTMQYLYNVDVTSFSASGKVRANFNFNEDKEPEEGAAPEMADADVVWRRFEKEGCSVRMLHPQRFCDQLWRLVAALESYLQCPVGCNAYLTPPGTQGFAPHWDDIDAFVLQLEGSKTWRLHAPTDPEHVLPRYSSRDFSQDELGDCVLETVLQPGDLLYLPRGTVHQAESMSDSHSLHITLSANQQRSWAVFLEQALPEALRLAAQSTRELRRTLPRDYLDYMGVTHEEESDNASRGEFVETCAELVEKVLHHMPLDPVADQMAVQFLQQRLPPPPLLPFKDAAGKPQGVFMGRIGGSSSTVKAKGQSSGVAVEAKSEEGGAGGVGPDTCVVVPMPGIARLVIDSEGPEPIAEVHHCMANRRDLHAHKAADEQQELEEALEEVAVEAAGVLEFPIGCAELLDVLLAAGCGPHGRHEAVKVSELPAPEGECDVEPAAVVKALLEAGAGTRLRSIRPSYRACESGSVFDAAGGTQMFRAGSLAAATGPSAAQPLGQCSRSQRCTPAQRPRAAGAAACTAASTAAAAPSSQAPSLGLQLYSSALLGQQWDRRRACRLQHRSRRQRQVTVGDTPDRSLAPQGPMMGDDQASTIYTAQADLGSSMDEADLAAVPYQAAPDGVAAADAGAPPPAPGGIPHRWKVVSMMAASFVLCNMDKVNMSVAVIPMARELGWSAMERGLVSSSFFWGYSLTQIPAGWVSTNIGGARVLFAGVALWSLGTLIAPPAAKLGLVALCATRLFVGLGEGLAPSSATNVMARIVPEGERARAVTTVFGGLDVGSAVGLLLCGPLIHWFGWQSVFYLFALLGLVWCAAWPLFKPEEQDANALPRKFRKAVAAADQAAADAAADAEDAAAAEAAKKLPVPWGTFLRSPAVWAVIVAHFCFNWGYYTLLAWLPSYLALGLNVEKSSLLTLIPYVSMTLMTPLVGPIADGLVSKHGWEVTSVRKLCQGISFAGPALCMIALAFLTPITPGAGPTGLIVAIMSLAFALGAWSRAGLYCNHQDLSPKYAAALLGLSNTAGALPGVLGVTFAGYLLDTTGSWAQALFFPTAVCQIFGLVIYSIFASSKRQAWA